jgi:two-component system, sensor histidine kinase and response regulator
MKILIAEDSRTSLTMLKAMLQKFGHEVYGVENGRDAIEFLSNQESMLVLLDWVMPEVPGLNVVENLRRKNQNHYIIMLTAKSEKEDVTAALDAGANDYIVKPFDPEELRARVDAGVRVLDAEAKLTEATERMSEFVGIVSHDLRNPVSTIISATDLMEISADHLPDCLPLVRTSAERALNIITDLLDLMAIQGSRIELKMETGPLESLIDSCIGICGAKAKKKGVTLRKIITSNPRAYFDEHRLAQVLDNLLSNAIKFTPAGGEVFVECKVNDDQVELRVTDNGVGIPEKVIPDLFEKEKNISSAGTDGEQGTGFGLPLAQEIIRAHGSEIQVESQEGKGSTFSFFLGAIA